MYLSLALHKWWSLSGKARLSNFGKGDRFVRNGSSLEFPSLRVPCPCPIIRNGRGGRTRPYWTHFQRASQQAAAAASRWPLSDQRRAFVRPDLQLKLGQPGSCASSVRYSIGRSRMRQSTSVHLHDLFSICDFERYHSTVPLACSVSPTFSLGTGAVSP